MKVLYLNHTSRVSGAEWFLLDLIQSLPDGIEPIVACPEGPLSEALTARGIRTVNMTGTNGSLRLHPVHTSRAALDMIRAAVQLRLLTRRLRPDIVHANSIRSGLIAALATVMGGMRPVVHLHDCLPPGGISNLVRRIVRSRSCLLFANSDYTAHNFVPDPGPNGPAMITVHNAVDVERFCTHTVRTAQVREELGISPADPVVGVIGQLSPWKGQDDAIRAVMLLRPRWPALKLVIVGEVAFSSPANRYDNVAYRRRLDTLVRDGGLQDAVLFLGQRDDIPDILSAIDILVVPSWEEPFGRVVVEGMAMQVPVVATAIGGPAEVITNEVDGLLVAPRQPILWAKALDRLLAGPDERIAMGKRARATVESTFRLNQQTAKVIEGYRGLLQLAPERLQ